MLNKFDVNLIRNDFPYLKANDNLNSIYFDNAATTQKPIQVINAIDNYYKYENGNPHRGAHIFSLKATEIYENGREKVAKFINAKYSKEIIFTRNTTESLNLIAYSWAMNNLKKDDEIVLSIMEHHSNLCNWQFIAQKTGAKLKYLYIDKETKQIDWEDFTKSITDKTKIFTITQGSNVVSTMPNVKEMINYVKLQNKDILTIIDGAQSIPHMKIDVQDLNCDFFAFSGHKMLAAMGIGVLYGKKDLLNSMTPFLYGGDMIEYVYEKDSKYLESPARFEAGTQNVSGVASLSAAIDYIDKIGIENIKKYEKNIMDYAYNKMKELDYIDIYTTNNENRGPVLTFNFKDIHSHDVASILDSYDICIRSGHHCAQPLHRYLGINSSCRASFSFYNTIDEIDYFIEHLSSVRRVMKLGSK